MEELNYVRGDSMRIAIFGVGRFYQEKKNEIPSRVEIVVFIDNNPKLQGKIMDGHPIVAPSEVTQFPYDKIILMSISEEAMKSQLLKLGIKREDIWYWECFSSEMHRGMFNFYCGNDSIKENGKRILIISTYLDYTGAPIAAMHAAKVLQDRGNNVFVAAVGGEEAFVEEMKRNGINIVLCLALPYMHQEELFWVKQFDVVLVNVFLMFLCAYEISKIKPVFWWIHEASELYQDVLTRFWEYTDIEKLKNVNICAVSNVAQRNFNFYFPNRIKYTLQYGIPDQGKNFVIKKETECLFFAIIGTVCSRKAQDVFLNAIGLLKIQEKKNVRFLVIGSIWADTYGNQVKEQAIKDPAIEIMGVLTRTEISEIFKKIDIVVCPSLEDPLPIVATEAMMYGKPCIVSDATGTAEYIEDGKNGLICKAGDPEDLCEKMRWVIHNQEKLHAMGSNARKIYEKHFSMKAFGRRLETALQDTVDNWERTECEKKWE